ncbi:outer membrane protein assembly factor BamA [Chitinophaga terrae (ex Kim and Jung 2007)]|uniref:translocation and assembly module lipoprotein TamL n=1 Tax=Chitinophaga terrae (ex Kim and Jung 2007) TaxID=408074 RepID=UPI0027885AD9|nr:BamA/TamA family outer membrane protein [Chitinophaga terrae (ex Kim and Jung 2007)]MDQ0105441.1 outer membrane protein assembly factor BamA [Chitinophaga terrae (ex Kim and Jung 2007)]
MRIRSNHIFVSCMLFCCIVLLISGCSTTRTVPEGDRLYTGSKVTWTNDTVTKKRPKDYGSLMSGLEKRIRPNPNRKFLGMPIKLWLYNLGKEPKGKGLNYLLRKKWGEPPVLLSSAKPDYTSDILESYLVDNGFFQAEVTNTIKYSGKKKASINYTVSPNHRYTINRVMYIMDTHWLGRTILKSRDESSLIAGAPYSLDSIKAERERIHAYLKEQGYYYFTPDYLIVQADSTLDGKVNLYVKVKDNTPALALRPYKLRDITLFPDYSLDNDSTSTLGTPVNYKGIYIVDSAHRFKSSAFDRSVFLRPDSLYRLSSHDITLQRLINLGVFKFVKGQFSPVRDTSKHNIVGGNPNAIPRDTSMRRRRDSTAVRDTLSRINYATMLNNRFSLDSGWLDAKFYLTPYQRRSLQAELRGTSKSNGFIGSQVNLTAKNRNWLHRAALLEIGLKGGMEWQTGNKSAGGSNSYMLGGEVAVTFPRFITPFKNLNIRTPYVPRTRISAGYELYSRSDLYNLNAYTLQLQYLWQKSQYLNHSLAPIAVTYVLPTKTTAAYDSILKNDPSQRSAIEKQFILGGNYTITYNTLQPNKVHSFFVSGNIDISGNIAGLIIPKNDTGQKTIIGNSFAQYERFTLEGRHYWKIGNGKQWINRLLLGYGLPYGNSQTLPFVKQFFTGGSSSIRAFRARTLGPGSYHNPAVDSSALLANEAGDIKLEFNSEVRIHLASVFNFAAFVDAGNIWLQKDVPDKPGSKFKFDSFYKEIAVGGGIGLRIDASIVVVRLDLATPFRIPYLPEKERWVFNKINFGDPEWRKKNLILNIAIGYPF